MTKTNQDCFRQYVAPLSDIASTLEAGFFWLMPALTGLRLVKHDQGFAHWKIASDWILDHSSPFAMALNSYCGYPESQLMCRRDEDFSTWDASDACLWMSLFLSENRGASSPRIQPFVVGDEVNGVLFLRAVDYIFEEIFRAASAARAYLGRDQLEPMKLGPEGWGRLLSTLITGREQTSFESMISGWVILRTADAVAMWEMELNDPRCTRGAVLRECIDRAERWITQTALQTD